MTNTSEAAISYRFGRFLLVPKQFALYEDGRAIHLTPIEFDVLEFLITHRDAVWNLEQILNGIRGVEEEGGQQTVKNSISRFRKILGESSIENIRTRGYRFQAAVTELIDPAPGSAHARDSVPAVAKAHGPMVEEPTRAFVEIPSRPWDPSVHPPGALLRADCAAGVPFHGRVEEGTELEAWCDGDEGFGLRLYTAPGGMGKTRLFLHLCDNLLRRGWRAGFLRSDTSNISRQIWEHLLGQPGSLLIVVDYAETRRAEVVSLLAGYLGTTCSRVRIVLLARDGGDWWEEMRREGSGVGDLLSGPATRKCSLQPLAMTPKDRERSYWIAAKSFAAVLGKAMPAADSLPDFHADHLERVLLLHMTALAAVDGVQVKGDQGILDYVLGRERRFWYMQAQANALMGFEDGIAQAMAVVTLGGGANDRRHMSDILRQIPLLRDQSEIARRAIANILHATYPGRKWIEPILPDLLGEHLIQIELGKDETGTLLALVMGPS